MTSMTGDGGRGVCGWRIAGWSLAAGLLLAPFIAMQVTREVNWSALDFAVAAVLLGSVGGAIEFLVRQSGNWTYRIGAAVMAIGVFFLVWVNLAVGIIGSEGNAANWMYAGLVAVIVGGGIVARFRAAGLVRVMLAAVVVTAAIAGVAVVGDMGAGNPIWPRDTLGVSAILCAFWGAAAVLFHRAARVER
jgi:hypothetical protein